MTGVAPSVCARVDVALRTGETVRVRRVRSDDAPRLEAFLSGLSQEGRFFRFFSGAVNVHAISRWFATDDDGVGLVATTGADERVVAHALYVPTEPGVAEIAFAVSPELEGQGLATTLLRELADLAAAAGIERFTGVVLAHNHKMIRVFRDSGFHVEVVPCAGELEVTLSTSLTEAGRRRFEARECEAAAAAVAHVLRPSSVVVVGASRRRGTVGGEVLRNLAAGGFTGRLAAVNPSARDVAGIDAYPSVADVPGDVELAIVAVPGPATIDVARQCAMKGVKAMLVLSGGFAEAGGGGARRQAELLEVCRGAGMRLVGPNCLGVVNTDPAVALNATFAPVRLPRGRAGFASHSGAFGITAARWAADKGVGLSSFVSLGDRADLSGADVLQYWERDGATDVCMLYLESFGNPRRFGRVARRLSASKPVIAVKSGRTAAGRRAASSHTGALLAASDTSVDALFEHAGVIRVDTVSELFDVAALLTRQPLPAGRRVAIVTNAGGPGILCADACAAAGMEVPRLSGDLQRLLGARLPGEASVTNPVDLVASATARDFERAVGALVRSGEVDAVVTIFVRPLATTAAQVAAAVRGAAAGAPVPVLSAYLDHDAPPLPGDDSACPPQFTGVEEAARALAHAVRHAEHRATVDVPQPPAGVDADAGAAAIADALACGEEWLAPERVEALLRAYGIPLVRGRRVRTPHGARVAAAALGGPLALKAIAPGLVHKSDAGAVALDLPGPAAVERAAREMRTRLQAAGHEVTGFVVQRMAPAGPELLVGIVGDPHFGPLVAVGAGGVAAELLGDVQVRLAPVGPGTAAAMVRGLRTFPLLDGYRGATPCDVAAVEDVVLRVAALAEAHPEVAELDCNPLVAGPAGAVVVDARVRLEPAPEPPPYGSVGT